MSTNLTCPLACIKVLFDELTDGGLLIAYRMQIDVRRECSRFKFVGLLELNIDIDKQFENSRALETAGI
jgi:hypothetical protein